MELNTSLKIFKALSDPSRLLIISSLIEKPQYVEELSKRLNLSISTISFHLKKLENADLIYKVKEQYYTIFHLNKEIFQVSLKELISFKHNETSSQEERLKNYSEKVLSIFVEKGRISKLPSQNKKRLIILEAFITLFEPGRVYREQEVDEIIKKVFDDHCTIRRYMVDENMIFRKKGKYTINEKYKNEFTLPLNPFNILNEIEKKSEAPENKMKTRTEIKKEYKQTPRPMGVYKLEDLIHKKIYIGSSKNLEGIFNRHRFELSTGMHQLKEIQSAWNISGEKGILLQVLDSLEPKEDPAYDYADDLRELQKLWIDKLRKEGTDVFSLFGTMIRET